MEIGLFSFVETPPEPADGRAERAAMRLAHLLEEAELADRMGLDVFGVGEHHRPDYIASAPAVILAALAAHTHRIRLTSTVSVLSSDDPVRVFQQFATLDLLSGGRAELMAGRGSFTESFPLFGYDLRDYEELFEEKLDLLLALRDAERVTWSGRHRAPLEDQGVYPRPLQDPLPVWIASGGTPASVARAGTLGLPLAIAIIGGQPARFAPVVAHYRQAAARAGHEAPPLAISAHGFVAPTSEQAREIAYEPFTTTMNRIGRERGWPPMGRDHFERECGPDGALFVGSPEEVADKIVRVHGLMAPDRLLLQMSVGPVPHAQMLDCVRLYAEQVAPRVRAAVEERVED